MKAIFTGILFLSLLINNAQAATITSKPGVKLDWNDLNTWVGGKVPTSADDVQLVPGSNITLTADAVCKSLVVQNIANGNNIAASLTITGSYILNVGGDVTINGGNAVSFLSVGDGVLLVGGSMMIDGRANDAELRINAGTVNITGNLIIDQGPQKKQLITGKNGVPNTFTVGGTVNVDKATVVDVNINEFKDYYYRSKASNKWHSAATWECSKDDATWNAATTSPPSNARMVTVLAFHEVRIAKSPIILDNALVINGILDCETYVITGKGTFTLNIGGTIKTKNKDGITSAGASGSIQMSGSRTYSADANYTYDGTVAQNTGNGLPSVLNGILTINSSVTMPAGVTLSQPTRIRKLVDITLGRLISNGNLTIESTASSNGNVRGPIAGGVLTSATEYLTGNVNVESWFSGGDITYRGTRTMSSPVTNVPVFEQLQQKMLISGQGAGFDAPATQETILTYHEPAKISDGAAAQYKSLSTGIKTSPVPGLGYFLLYRGDRVLDPSGTNPPQSLKATYTGVINQGDIRVDLSFTNNTGPRDDEYNGFNLVGNPYPSVIDWAKITRSSTAQIDNMVSIIKPGGGMTTFSNGVIINALPAGAAPPGNTSNTFYIQPGQGFYVRTKSAGTFLTFSEACKVVSQPSFNRWLSLPETPVASAGPIMAAPTAQQEESVPQVLRLNLQDSKNMDETAIVFQAGNKAVYGGADVTYFSGSSVSLSSVTSDGKNVAINFMPDIKEVPELKLWVNAATSGPVKLNFTDFKGVGEYQVFLKDAYLDKVVNVRVSPVYEFSIDKANANTFGSERFKLLLQAPVCTDVSSISLKGKMINEGVELSFVVKGGNNSSSFEIERSADGKVFGTIAQVLSKSQADYVFLDQNPLKGMSYYRLKQKGNSDIWIYSNVFSLELPEETLSVYPNPAANEIRVNFKSFDRDLVMSVYNVFGKKMKELSFKKQAELRGNISELNQGVYFIKLLDASNKQIMGWAKFYKN